jgi:hypothetical protein
VSEASEASYACGTAARWLPRVVAGSLLTAGLLAVGRLGMQPGVPGARTFRMLLVMATALAALWIVRKGGEVRIRVHVAAAQIRFELGRRGASLSFEDIEGVRYEAPFGPSRFWLPATVLVGRDGRGWRLSALLDSGGRLVDEIVERSGREDIAAWVDALGIRERMGRARQRVRVGYAIAAGIVLVAALYALR